MFHLSHRELHDGLSRIAETMEVEEDEDSYVVLGPSVSSDAPRSAGSGSGSGSTPSPSFSFGFGSNSAGLPPR
jgi:hypothetical protein